MNCEIYDVMNKDEQYARGWVRIFGKQYTAPAAQMAQYALDLLKLKQKHEEACDTCQGNQ